MGLKIIYSETSANDLLVTEILNFLIRRWSRYEYFILTLGLQSVCIPFKYDIQSNRIQKNVFVFI